MVLVVVVHILIPHCVRGGKLNQNRRLKMHGWQMALLSVVVLMNCSGHGGFGLLILWEKLKASDIMQGQSFQVKTVLEIH